MQNKDRALNAIEVMTVRADHIKQVAEYIIEHNEFESIEIAEALDIPLKNISRIVQNLERTYRFCVERQRSGRSLRYTVTDCQFDGKRTKAAERVKKEPELVPLRRPESMNRLWAMALQMSI